MRFPEKLANSVSKNNSLLSIGLDTDPALMPGKINVFEFNKAIIDATADLVCAYKPNFAFYEAMGIDGLKALLQTVEYVPKNIPVIADAKRSDIGNTSKAYARAIFDYYGFDAVTVNPYLGRPRIALCGNAAFNIHRRSVLDIYPALITIDAALKMFLAIVNPLEVFLHKLVFTCIGCRVF